MDFEPQAIVNSVSPSPAVELLAPGARFTLAEIERLFEENSLLLRENAYALAAPPNTVQARRPDWRMFKRFCAERRYTPLPTVPVVVREFLKASFGSAEPKSVATVERYLSTIAHAHTLTDLPDPIKAAQIKSAHHHVACRSGWARSPRPRYAVRTSRMRSIS